METNSVEGVPLADEGNSSSLELSIIESSVEIQDETVNYQTADEEGSSKYFSMIDGESTLEASREAVSLEAPRIDASPPSQSNESNFKSDALPTSLSSASVSVVNKLHIHERIDAANILSGGVDIFDDCENSVDEHDLVIDDDPHPDKLDVESAPDAPSELQDRIDDQLPTTFSISKDKEISAEALSDDVIAQQSVSMEAAPLLDGDAKHEEVPAREITEDVEEAEAKPDNYSALLQGNLPEGSSQVMLLIDEKNVEAVHIGEGVYIYKNNDGDLTAMQITLNEEDHPNIKYLHVGKNEDGNLEVYEEQVNQVAVTNEELESLKSNELAENAKQITPAEEISPSTVHNEKETCDSVAIILPQDVQNPTLPSDDAICSQENEMDVVKPDESVTCVISLKESQDVAISTEKEATQNDLNESGVSVDRDQPPAEETVSIGETQCQQEDVAVENTEQIDDSLKNVETKIHIEDDQSICDVPKLDVSSSSTIESIHCDKDTDTSDEVKNLEEPVKDGKDICIEKSEQTANVPVISIPAESPSHVSNTSEMASPVLAEMPETTPSESHDKNTSEDIFDSEIVKESSECVVEPQLPNIEVDCAMSLKFHLPADIVTPDDGGGNSSECPDILRDREEKDKIILSDSELNRIVNEKLFQDDNEKPETSSKPEEDQKCTDDNVIEEKSVLLYDEPCLTNINVIEEKSVLLYDEPCLTNINFLKSKTDDSVAENAHAHPSDSETVSEIETISVVTAPKPSEIPDVNTDAIENYHIAEGNIGLISFKRGNTPVVDIKIDTTTETFASILDSSEKSAISPNDNDVEDNSLEDSKSKLESQSSMESDDDPDEDDLVRGEPVTGDCDAAWPGPESGDDSVSQQESAISNTPNSVSNNPNHVTENTETELPSSDLIVLPKDVDKIDVTGHSDACKNDEPAPESSSKKTDVAETHDEIKITTPMEESNPTDEILDCSVTLNEKLARSEKVIFLIDCMPESAITDPPLICNKDNNASQESNPASDEKHENISPESIPVSAVCKSISSECEEQKAISPKSIPLTNDNEESLPSKSVLLISKIRENVSPKSALLTGDIQESDSVKCMLSVSSKHEPISPKPLIFMDKKRENVLSKSSSFMDEKYGSSSRPVLSISDNHKSVSPKSTFMTCEKRNIASPNSTPLLSNKREIVSPKPILFLNDKRESVSPRSMVYKRDKHANESPKSTFILSYKAESNSSLTVSPINDKQTTVNLHLNKASNIQMPASSDRTEILEECKKTAIPSPNCFSAMKKVECKKVQSTAEVQKPKESMMKAEIISKEKKTEKPPSIELIIPTRSPVNVSSRFDLKQATEGASKPHETKPHNILENNNESLLKTSNRDSLKNFSRKSDTKMIEKKIDAGDRSVAVFQNYSENFKQQSKSDEALSRFTVTKSPQKTSLTVSPDLPSRVSPKNNMNIITDSAILKPQTGFSSGDRLVHSYSSQGPARTYSQNCRNSETKKMFSNDHSTPISNKYDYGLMDFGKSNPQKMKLSTLWNNQQTANRPVARDNRPPLAAHPSVKTYSSSPKLSNKLITVPDKKTESAIPSRPKEDGSDGLSPNNKPAHRSPVFSGVKRLLPYGPPLKSPPPPVAQVSPKEDENVIGIQQYIGTASDANAETDALIHSAEDTASSADESISNEQTAKNKSRQPRKQVFTPVTRSDMEIIFPNLYTAEKEASKQPKPARLPYKPRGRPSNVESQKPHKKDITKEKIILPINVDISKDEVSPTNNILVKEKHVSDVCDDLKHSDVKINNYPIKEINTPYPEEIAKDKTISNEKIIIQKTAQDDLDLNSTVSKENVTQNINLLKEVQTPEAKSVVIPVNSEKRDDILVESPSSSAKRKRGRPKKITTVSTLPADVSPTIIDSPDATFKPESDQKIDDLRSDESLSDKGSPRVNSISPFGKINETIVCPICFKTFRTENVLLKHVKHCNGAIDKEALKSPKRRKMVYEEMTADSPETVLSPPPLKARSEQTLFDDKPQTKQSLNEDTNIELPKRRNSDADTSGSERISEVKPRSKLPIHLHVMKNELNSSSENVKTEILSGQKAVDTNSDVIVIDDSFDTLETKPSDRKDIVSDELNAESKNITDNLHKSAECIMTTKVDTKSEECIPSLEKIDPESDKAPKINASIVSRLPREKMVGGGRKIKDTNATSILSPMSRLSKILKTKPPVRDSISCEICGKTFRQLAHMVYHRDKHESDEAMSTGEKPKLNTAVIKPKTDLEPAELDVVPEDTTSQRGSQKPQNLIERSGDVKSRRTSAASVKSEPEAGFRCDACDKSFRKLHHLVEHRELHAAAARSSPEPVARPEVPEDATCTGCGKSFRKRHHMVEHRDVHCSPTKKGRNEDDVDVRLSVASSASDESNSCGICGKSYRKLHHMVEHRESHTERTDFINTKDIIHECARCYMVFPNENSLNKHTTACLRKRIISRMKSANPVIPEEAPLSDSDAGEQTSASPLTEPVEVITVSNELPAPIVPEAKPSLPNKEKIVIEAPKKPLTKKKVVKPPPLPPPKMRPKRLSEPKIVGDDKSKYKIDEDSEIKYKINPAFDKSSERPTRTSGAKIPVAKPKNKRLSEPLAKPTRLSGIKAAIVKPKNRRTSDSALAGLRVPSSKMLETIYEECSVRYSFPPATPKAKDKAVKIDKAADVKEKEKKTRAKTVAAPPKKPTKPVVKVPAKSMPSNRITGPTLTVGKRKSIGGRKSIEGKKLPIAKKLQLKCCKQIFNSQATLAEHRKTHKARQSHKCDCGQTFDSEVFLRRHMDTEHTPPKSFKCSECGTSVRTASQYQKHKKEHEAAQKLATQRKAAGKATNPPKKTAAAKTPEQSAKKAVKRKSAHGGVPLSDKMRKAIATGILK